MSKRSTRMMEEEWGSKHLVTMATDPSELLVTRP